MMHGDFFEQRTGEPYYTEQVINMAHQTDPDALFFYNDFQVVANKGDLTYVRKMSMLTCIQCKTARADRFLGEGGEAWPVSNITLHFATPFSKSRIQHLTFVTAICHVFLKYMLTVGLNIMYCESLEYIPQLISNNIYMLMIACSAMALVLA